MSFFKPREPADLGKPAEIGGRGKARDLVQHDFAPRARRPADPDISGHVGTLLNRMAASSLQEIDELIFRLRQRREQLVSESERVQREIVEYATLSRSTLESTKIISETLAQYSKSKVPDVPRMSHSRVEDVPAAEQRNAEAAEQRNAEIDAKQLSGETEAPTKSSNGAGGSTAQHGKDEAASGDKAEDVVDPATGVPRTT